MSDKYYVSVPGSSRAPPGFSPFNPALFKDAVECLCGMFYGDVENMVVMFLLHNHNVAYPDQQIAEGLNLAVKQVRGALDASLCRDHIVEMENPQVRGESSRHAKPGSSMNWYRLSPNVICASIYRLQQVRRQLQEQLARWQMAEEFNCDKCNRVFDTLRAISLVGADGLFHCDICDRELTATNNKDKKAEVESRILRATQQLSGLERRLELCRGMYIPRPMVVKKTMLEKIRAERAKEEAAMENHTGPSVSSGVQEIFGNAGEWKPQAIGPSPNQSSAFGKTAVVAPSWLNTESTTTKIEVVNHNKDQVKKRPAEDSFDKEAFERVKRQELAREAEKLKHFDVTRLPGAQEVMAQRSVKAELKAEEPSSGDKPDVMVTVAGVKYKLSVVRQRDDLQDKMTDEEYERYDDEVQKLLSAGGGTIS
ncbi:transcription factor TFIIE, putative [Perkinsus marinus ATCC 50983]|uniref:Transcription factor TFIIE, putative n=1 Tax=Perkinsus marinus (strain ATCC 50983 / TXsc) TaxID=423536 RepID=C5M0T3_PERM5|nr:transcription factor TFIIE, putative [Perkinsus marinus ATCC 50983]EEQ97441.1 transcription factor TFIIE, putative [Perkinsus marinus ATCC 50983]|eukprot:XP_002764724.1 transcription factor TFIIE, putative [Perkinsus marinus ATCC 50983]